MPGVLINCILILLGSLLGVLFRDRLPARFLAVVVQCLGLGVIAIGVTAAIGTGNTLCMIVSLVLGTILGEAIDIERRLERAGDWIKAFLLKGDGPGSSFTQGFVTASVLYCVGAMAILGSIEAGIHHDYTILISKAVIDGVFSISLAAAVGIGVAFSALPILIYEGAITLLAGMAAGVLTQPLINEMSAVGGCIILGIGLNMLKVTEKPLKVGNMLPAVFVPFLYLPAMQEISRLFG